MESAHNSFFSHAWFLAMVSEDSNGEPKLSHEQMLMKEVAQGSHSAMEEIIAKWKNSLFRFFDRSIRNKADAEDLTQRVFIRVYQSAPRYQPKAKFSSYLFTIARNLLIDEIKKKQRQQTSTYSDDWAQEGLEEQKEGLKDWNEILDFAMKEIPEYYSTALLLRVQRELSYGEIAEIMKVSESRIKTWIHRARNHLKKTLKHHGK